MAIAGAMETVIVGYFSVSSSAPLRLDGPFSTSLWALWIRRSQIASACVGSEMCACHFCGGTWLVTIVDLVP